MSDAVEMTATAVAMQSGPTPHDLMVSRVASLIAKRQYGPGHIGYESTHREAAVDYVNAAMSVWFSLNHPARWNDGMWEAADILKAASRKPE